MRTLDAWAVRAVLAGVAINGELELVSTRFGSIAKHLVSVPLEHRLRDWGVFLMGCQDRDAIIASVADADPGEPPPLEDDIDAARYATLADVARIISGQPWLWRGWIASGVLNALASEPGTGKTRFGLDIARRLWFGLPWPDGQPNELPKGTRTLWVQGDRNFAEMLQAAREFGLPDEAVVLGSSPEEPFGGLDLDDPVSLAELSGRIKASKASLVIIDTIGMVTNRNLCRPEEARAFSAPIIDIANETGAAFLGQTHLSLGKEALGRRIVEKARVVLKMTQPDPEGQPNRRRLWVDKSAIVKPLPLGITMGSDGNDYDGNPPSEPPPDKKGRPSVERDKAVAFITDALSGENDQTTSSLKRKFLEADIGAEGTFWNARDFMRASGSLVCDGKSQRMHLVTTQEAQDPPLDHF